MTHTKPAAGLMAIIGALAISLLSQPTLAQEEAIADAGPNRGKVSLSAGFEAVSEYHFRGIEQEDQDVIVQPYIEVGVDLFKGDDFIKSVDLSFGIWNSVHGADTGATSSWYEADWYVALAIGLPKNFTFSTGYTLLDAPSGAGGVSQFAEEIFIGLSYDDSHCWKDVTDIAGFNGLQPHVTIVFEINGGSDAGTQSGTYIELGIEPTFLVFDNNGYSVTLATPVTLGFGSDYYEFTNPTTALIEDSGFSYADFGLVATMPIKFIPADYGQWEASLGVHFLVLGNTAENSGDTNHSTATIATFGLSLNY